jgi:hypothetical protein
VAGDHLDVVTCNASSSVMAGLVVPAIHVFLHGKVRKEGVDARNKCGHDGGGRGKGSALTSSHVIPAKAGIQYAVRPAIG